MSRNGSKRNITQTDRIENRDDNIEAISINKKLSGDEFFPGKDDNDFAQIADLDNLGTTIETYDPEFNYSIDNFSTYSIDGIEYLFRSLSDDNTGNTPTIGSSSWQVIGVTKSYVDSQDATKANQSALDNEATARQNGDQTNANAISVETSRAQGVEADLLVRVNQKADSSSISELLTLTLTTGQTTITNINYANKNAVLIDITSGGTGAVIELSFNSVGVANLGFTVASNMRVILAGTLGDLSNYLAASSLGIEPSKNLFNANGNFTSGQMDAVTGAILGSADFSTTDYFIPVTEGDYFGSSVGAPNNVIRRHIKFDQSFNIIPDANGNNPTNLMVIPSGVFFVKIVSHNLGRSTFQLERGTERTSYEPYAPRIISIDGITIKNADKDVYNKSETWSRSEAYNKDQVDSLLGIRNIQGVSGSYYDANGNLITNSSSFYAEVEVEPSTTYKIDCPLSGTGRNILVTDSDNNVLIRIQGTTTVVNTREVTTPDNGVKLKISTNTGTGLITVTKLSGGAQPVLKTPVLKLPNYAYAIDYSHISDFGGANASGQIVRLFKEGFIKDEDDIKLNGFDTLPINPNVKNTTNKQSFSIPLKITGQGLNSLDRTMTLFVLRSVLALGKMSFVLPIGDSITNNKAPLPSGEGSYGWSDILLMLGSMLNKDHGVNTFNLQCYGTRNFITNTINYKGESLSFSGNNEGRNGWTVASYLRHICMVRQGFMTSTSSGGFFYDKAGWDLLGLGKKIDWTPSNFAAGYDSFTGITYVPYTGTDAQKTLLRTTPSGRYLPDLTADVYNGMNNNSTDPTNILNRSQPYNSGLNGILMNAIVYLTDNPLNPFYDFNTANTTGTHGFNMQVYENRYRTRDSNGNKLLLSDPNIGTKINSGNISSINVGVPTHVPICLTENDKQSYESNYSASMGYTEVKLMVDLIKTVYPSAVFCLFKTRRLGTMNAREDMDIMRFNNSQNTYNYNFNEYLINEITGSAESKENIWYLPVYSVSSPQTRITRYDYDPFFDKKSAVFSNDLTHPSTNGNFDIAYQVLAWILNTFNT